MNRGDRFPTAPGAMRRPDSSHRPRAVGHAGLLAFAALLLSLSTPAWAQFAPSAIVADFNKDGKLDIAGFSVPSLEVSLYLGDGAGRFGPPSIISLPFSGGPAPAAGDFNGDGTLDLVRVGVFTGVSVSLGDGSGGFAEFCTRPLPPSPTSGHAVGVAVADFNTDGRQDVAVAASGELFLLLGDGSGCLSEPKSVAQRQGIQSITSADLNGDGRADLVAGTSDGLLVLMGDGKGGFVSSMVAAGVNAASVVVADLNADGKPDVAILALDSSAVSILIGDGFGRFAPPATFPVLDPNQGFDRGQLMVGDFNSDGAMDLAVAPPSYGAPDGAAVFFLLGDGAGRFSPAVEGLGGVARWAAVGDFDGDGRDDVVVSYPYPLGLTTLLGGNVGRFSRPTTYPMTPGPVAIATGDIDKDGKVDIAALTASGGLSILIGDGSGGVAATVNGSAPPLVTAMVAADFNDDGTLDLAVLDNSPAATVLIGDGAGGFAAGGAQALGGGFAKDLAVADFNGDGKPDLIVATGSGVSVLLGDGLGGFGMPGTYPVSASPLYNAALFVAVGDFNGDGRPDVVASTYFDLVVLLGDGAGGLGPAMSLGTPGHYFDSVGVADFNGDGKPDIVAAGYPALSIFLGDGAGGFGAPLPQFASQGRVVLGDFNGDGKADVAFRMSVGNSIQILAGDGAGHLTAGPLLLLPPLSAAGPFATADFNGDGRLDLAAASTAGAVVLLGAGSADVSVAIDDGVGAATPGQTVTYVVTATNNGPNDAKELTVSDLLPVQLTGAAWSCVASPGSTCTPSGSGDLVDSINLSNGGTATYTLTATVAAGARGSMRNSARLALPSGVTDPVLANNTASDTDLLPSSLAIDDVTVGDTGAPAVFTVTLAPASSVAVTVAYATADGTAAAGSDYSASSGVLTFLPGETTQTVTVPVAPETTLEETMSFFVRLAAPTNGLLSKATGEAWILNDTQGQRLEFGAPNYWVSQAGRRATITVTRRGGTAGTVTADYATSDGSAVAGVHYTATSGIIAFEPGDVARTFTVPVTNDSVAEGNRTVLLTLTNARGGAVLGGKSSAVLTILDTNVAGKVQFSSLAYGVNESGSAAKIWVTRTAGTASGVTVDYATSAGTAAPGKQYQDTTGTLTFDAGVARASFSIPILDDGRAGPDTTVKLQLANPGGGATLGSPSAAVLTIAQGNPVVEFSAGQYSVSEAGGRALIVVRVLHAGPATVHVGYATSPGSAVPDVDYKDTAGTLTFLPGQVNKAFTVALLKDGVADGDKTILLALSSPDVGALGQPNTAVLTIPDVNRAGTVQFGRPEYRVLEKGRVAVIDVRRTGGAAAGVTVNFGTSDGTAVAGTNYESTFGVLTFGTGVFLQTIKVPILDDGQVHGNQYVNLDLAAPLGGATLGARSFATLDILTDDPLIGFRQYDYSVREDGAQATIEVDRLGPLSNAVTIDYATFDGTAVAGTDYTAAGGTLTFGKGVARRTFPVEVTDDALVEGDQTVGLQLSNAQQGAALGDRSTATLTITTDDPRLEFTRSDYVVAAGVPQAAITVRRLGPATGTVSVHFATLGSVEVSGNLTFAPGVTAKAFMVPLAGSVGPEPVQLVLCAPSGAVLGAQDTAVLTIRALAPPGPVAFSLRDYSVGESGPIATIAVRRTGRLAEAATVDYATADGTAIAGTHYLPAEGTLLFGRGEKEKTFTVTVLDDGVPGGNRTVNLSLGRPVATTLGANAAATLWIVGN